MTNAVTVSSRSREIAGLLLSIGALKLSVTEPFTYASGAKGPIYCDNRVLVSYPKERRQVIDAMAELVKQEIGPERFDLLAGVSTSGIPFCCWLSDQLDKPMVYVREAPKEHGLGKRVEGVLRSGQRSVVIEDLVTTGGSAISTVEGLRNEGSVVEYCVAIFTYERPAAATAFTKAGVQLLTLSSIGALLEEAESQGKISGDEAEEVRSWQRGF